METVPGRAPGSRSGSRSVPQRVVLDTNVWLDWLVFRDPSIALLQSAVAEGRAEVVIDAACLAELERVLAYPLGRHTLDAAGQASALEECRRIAVVIEMPGALLQALPRCRDPDDQKFLALAAAAGVEALLTKDAALLALKRRTPFSILRAAAFVPLY